MNIIIVSLFLLIIDNIWIFVMNSFYNKHIRNIQNSDLHIKYLGAIIAYLLMILSIVFVVKPLLRKSTDNKITKSIKCGAIVGFIIYGIYNFTNYAIFTNYSLSLVIIDTLWGTFLYFLISLLLLA